MEHLINANTGLKSQYGFVNSVPRRADDLSKAPPPPPLFSSKLPFPQQICGQLANMLALATSHRYCMQMQNALYANAFMAMTGEECLVHLNGRFEIEI